MVARGDLDQARQVAARRDRAGGSRGPPLRPDAMRSVSIPTRSTSPLPQASSSTTQIDRVPLDDRVGAEQARHVDDPDAAQLHVVPDQRVAPCPRGRRPLRGSSSTTSSATRRCPRITSSSAHSLLPMPLLPSSSAPTPATAHRLPWTRCRPPPSDAPLLPRRRGTARRATAPPRGARGMRPEPSMSESRASAARCAPPCLPGATSTKKRCVGRPSTESKSMPARLRPKLASMPRDGFEPRVRDRDAVAQRGRAQPLALARAWPSSSARSTVLHRAGRARRPARPAPRPWCARPSRAGMPRAPGCPRASWRSPAARRLSDLAAPRRGQDAQRLAVLGHGAARDVDVLDRAAARRSSGPTRACARSSARISLPIFSLTPRTRSSRRRWCGCSS